jgi:dolichol-phosphate mannosyltransferase
MSYTIETNRPYASETLPLPTVADAFLEGIGKLERLRDHSLMRNDPIVQERLQWRAQTFRHLIHLLPGQSILELGCGKGLFTQRIHQATRGENPITAVTFSKRIPAQQHQLDNVEVLSWANNADELQARSFDFVVATGLLDNSNCEWLFQQAYKLLKPGGQVIFYERNPWNPFLQASTLWAKASKAKRRRKLYSLSELHERIAQAGFTNSFCSFNDFVYESLATRDSGTRVLQNLSILLENAPVVQKLACSILVYAQKAQPVPYQPTVSLAEHPQLHRAVSVVVPCHNEEMNLVPLVSRLVDLYGNYLHEIVLVDDNSRDNTREVITQLAERYPFITPVFRKPPNGVGRAIQDGYRAATGEYILSMDCDFQQLLPELRDMFDSAAKGADVVVGSRFSRHSVLLNYPFQKIVANRAFHLLARVMLSTKFRDVTNNLKLFKREVVEKMELTQPGFSINAETGLLPIINGYKIVEVPMSWINRTADMGVSSFKLAQVGGGYWHVLRTLWKNKFFGPTQAA